MIVIRHIPTGTRMMYPLMNINVMTTDLTSVEQYIPREFEIPLDQTPVPLYHPIAQTLNWAATPHDPLNQYKFWSVLNR
jgi:hypothetical protein